MNRLIILAALLLSSCFLKAQINLDSLYAIWEDETQTDSVRILAYNDYIWDGFLISDPDSAIILAEALMLFGQQNQSAKAKSIAFRLKGEIYFDKRKYSKALDYYERSLKIQEESGDKKGIGRSLSYIGNVYNANAITQKHWIIINAA